MPTSAPRKADSPVRHPNRAVRGIAQATYVWAANYWRKGDSRSFAEET